MKSLSHGLLIGLLGLLLSGSCLATGLAETSIPFRLYDHHIVVKGAIGELQDLNCAIDTGASFSVLDQRIANKLQLKGRSREVVALGKKVLMQEVILPELHLETARFHSVVARLGEIPRFRRARIDLLVGLDLLRRANFTLDYEKKEIRFGTTEPFDSSLRFIGRLPVLVVQMQVQNKPFYMLLDTGAGEVILFEHRTRGRISFRRAPEEKTIVYAGGKTKLQKIHLSDVTMGGSEWKQFTAFVLDPSGSASLDGVLGVSPLNFKRIHFDFQQNVISWEM